MPVTPQTQALLNQWKSNLETEMLRGIYNLTPQKIQQLHELENLLFGGASSASPIGPPIQNASLVISAPQSGDDVAGIVDGVWHPAVGDLLFSAEPTDPNGIPLEAQSVLILTRLPIDLLVSDTDEAWELKNIAAYASVDGTTPDFTQNSTLWGFPMGGLGGKAWIDRETALAIRALSRWEPAVGQTLPYPNRRLIGDCLFYRNPVPLPVFEPSLIFPFSGSSSSETVTTGNAIAPIAMTFATDATESDWVALPASSEKVVSLQIPASTGASEITFRIRQSGNIGDGVPLLDTSISLPEGGGLTGSDRVAALSGLAPLLDGRHEVRGIVDTANTTERIFYWINSGSDISLATAVTAETVLSFAANATESSWVALPDSPSKYATVSIPAGIDGAVTQLTFRARNVGDSGSGFPILDTAISIPATGGYGGANVIEELSALSPLLGGQHEIRGVLNAATPAAIDISLITPLSMATLQIRIQAIPSISSPSLTINAVGTVAAGSANAVVISGTSANIEDGQLVTVTIVDSTDSQQFSDTTAIASNAWSLTADLSGLAGGQTFTARANASNVAGMAADQVTDSFDIETSDPTISISTVAGDDEVTPAEAASVNLAGVTSNVEDGQTVTVAIFDATPTQVFTGTTTVASDAWSLAADLSGLTAAATFEVRADVSNLAGTAAPQATREISTEVVPTISISAIGDNIITPAEAVAVAIAGSTTNVPAGQTVTIAVFDATLVQVFTDTATVAANAWSLTADLSGLAAGSSFEVRAGVSRPSGTAATQATLAVSTEVTPTISISAIGDDVITAAEASSVVIAGAANVGDGQTVTITIDDTTPAQVFTDTTTVASSAWSLTADLSGLTVGASFTVEANVSSALGTAATQATRVITTENPPTISISPVSGNDRVSTFEYSSVAISGTTANVEDGQTVQVVILDTTPAQVFSGTATVSANTWSLTADLSGLTVEADYTVQADVTNQAGSIAEQATRTITISAVSLDFSGLSGLTQAQQVSLESQAFTLASGQTEYVAQTSIDLLAKLTSAWLFDDAGDLGNDSYGSNNGTDSGVTSITGVLSGGINGFNAANFIEIPSDASIQGGVRDFSICLWVRRTGSASGGIFTKDNFQVSQREYAVYAWLDDVTFFMGNGTGISVRPVGTLPLNEWTFVRASYQASNRELLLSTNQDTPDTVTASFDPVSTPESVRIGADGRSGGFTSPSLDVGPIYFFSDELMNDAEVAFLYNNGVGNLIPLPTP